MFVALLFAAMWTVTTSVITVTPRNQVVQVHNVTSFTCATNTQTYGIAWTLYNIDRTYWCTAYATNDSAAANCSSNGRHSVSLASGRYTLVIRDVGPSDAGTVVCTDLSPGGRSVAAHLGVVAGSPASISGLPTKCLIEYSIAVLNCTTDYYGDDLMAITQTWTSDGGQVVAGTPVRTPPLFTVSLTFQPYVNVSYRYGCAVNFQALSSSSISLPSNSNVSLDVLPPTSRFQTLSDQFYVEGCPTAFKVRDELGNVIKSTGAVIEEGTQLTCEAWGGTASSSTSYQWTNASGQLVVSGPKVTVPFGKFYLICNSTSTVMCMALRRACLRSTFVDGTGVAKGSLNITHSATDTSPLMSSEQTTIASSSTSVHPASSGFRIATIVLGILFGMSLVAAIVTGSMLASKMKEADSPVNGRGPIRVSSEPPDLPNVRPVTLNYGNVTYFQDSDQLVNCDPKSADGIDVAAASRQP